MKRLVLISVLLSCILPVSYGQGASNPSGGPQAELIIGQYAPPAPAKVSVPRMQCARTSGPMKIDGDLSEWANIPAMMLDRPAQAHGDKGKWDGPADLSGSARIAYDSQNLYLAFDVTDDVFNQPFSIEDIWKGDCVQFAIDPLEDRKATEFAADDQEFTLALSPKGPILLRDTGDSKGPIKSAVVSAVRKKDGGGVVYELAIPWSELDPLNPLTRKSFGFTFTLNDNDGGDAVKSYLELTPGIYRGKSPAAFAQVLLDYTQPSGGEELFLAVDTPKSPEASNVSFVLGRYGSSAQSLKAHLTAKSDGKTVVDSTGDVPMAKGTSLCQLNWRFANVPDGQYEVELTVQSPGGPSAVSKSSYFRVSSEPYLARIAELEKLIAQMASSNNPLYAKYQPSIDLRMSVVKLWAGDLTNIEKVNSLRESLEETEQIVAVISKGTDWFAKQRGHFAKAYVAPEDDSVQPYRVNIPADYDASKPLPLVVSLHGNWSERMTFDNWYAQTLTKANAQRAGGYASPLASRGGVLFAYPFGRGNTGYQLLGANDIFHVIDEVRKAYKVDESRIYLVGGSMGGAGTWFLASRYPDLWAGCSPRAGAVGLGPWQAAQTQPATIPAAEWQKLLARAGSHIFVLENLLHVPTAIFHGVSDGAVVYDNTDAAFARFRQLHYEMLLMASIREGHSVPRSLEDASVEWLLTYARPAAPSEVVYRTYDLRYNRAYWLEIDELTENYQMAEVRGSFSPGAVTISTRNINRLTVTALKEMLGDGKELAIDIDGVKVRAADVQPGGKVHLALKDDGKTWAVSAQQYRPGLVKRHGVSGPLPEVYTGRFLIVYSTGGSEAANKANQAAAEAFAKNLKGVTGGRFWGNFVARADTSVKDADLREANVILFGNPQECALTKKVADGLPISVADGKLTFRGKTYDSPTAAVRFIYPSPFSPGQYIVVNCAVDPSKLDAISTTGSQPDWMVFDTLGEAPAKPTEAGFFDKDWK